MSTTGIDTWAVDLADVGAIYPFQGFEVIMVIAGVAFWIIWHIWQITNENRDIAEEEKRVSDGGLIAEALEHEAEKYQG